MEFRSAHSTDEALSWLAQLGDDACPIAGGTDVMMQYARGEIAPRVLVHIEGVRELAAPAPGDSTAPGDSMAPGDAPGRPARRRYGALTTHLQLAQSEVVRLELPALAEAACTVGGWQTQSIGTLAGNLCNASPAADTAPPLLVADATVELAGEGGTRTLALDEFFVGRRRVARRPDELVTAIELSALGDRAGEVYLKLGRRGAMVVAVVGLALRLAFDAEGAVTSARLALCSVAPTPMRATAVEQLLVECGDAPPALEEAGRQLEQCVAPIDDSRASAAYRREVLAGLLGRAAGICRSRAADRRHAA